MATPHNVVEVKVSTGTHATEIPRGLEDMLRQLFESAELSGEVKVLVGQAVKGTPFRQGIENINVLGPVDGRNWVKVRVQPGSNDTSREYMVIPPAGMSMQELDTKLRLGLQKLINPEQETIAQTHQRVKTRLAALVQELNVTEEQLRGFDQKAAELSRRDGEFNQEIGALDVRAQEIEAEYRRQLEALQAERRAVDSRRANLRFEQEKLGQSRSPAEGRKIELMGERDELEYQLLELEQELANELEAQFNAIADKLGIDRNKAKSLLSGTKKE